MKWISYIYTHISPHSCTSLPFPHPAHLGHHRALSWAPCYTTGSPITYILVLSCFLTMGIYHWCSLRRLQCLIEFFLKDSESQVNNNNLSRDRIMFHDSGMTKLDINLSPTSLLLTHLSQNKALVCPNAETSGLFQILIMIIASLWVNIEPAWCMAHSRDLISRETLSSFGFQNMKTILGLFLLVRTFFFCLYFSVWPL